MKAEILALLRERKDFVSGQEICDREKVSRTAVWKAVNTLKKEGYNIVSSTNRGYKLIENEEAFALDFSQNELESRMRTNWVGRPLIFHPEIGSTNIEAKRLAEEGAKSGLLILADYQTKGRGRRGRFWDSPKEKNIYYTLMLKPDFPPEKVSMLTIVMALAVCKGMIKAIGKEEGLGIKWPNDIVCNGKKLCGILTELNMERDYIQNVIIGVGINVKRQEFAEEIREKATDLETEFDMNINRSVLTADIMEEFEFYYEEFLHTLDLSKISKEYMKYLVNKDRVVCVLDPKGEYRGKALGINKTGELIVEKEDGSQVCVFAGEVSVRGIYGYV